MKRVNHQYKGKLMKICSALLVVFLILCLTAPAQAAIKEYRISFKAGMKGSFQGESSYTVNLPYGSDAAKDVAVAETMIQNSLQGSGYYFTGWSPSISEKVERRATYVAQYARIIEEAVYRINYVDTYGNPVATQKVISAELKASVTAYAPDISGYTVDQVKKQTVIDKKDGTEITFVYMAVPAGQAEETSIVVIPGEEVIRTIYETTNVSQNPGNQEQTMVGQKERPTNQNTPSGEETTPSGGNNTEQETAESATTDTQEPTTQQVTVKETDENVPLANPNQNQDGRNIWIYIGVGVAVLLALLIVLIICLRKRFLKRHE